MTKVTRKQAMTMLLACCVLVACNKDDDDDGGGNGGDSSGPQTVTENIESAKTWDNRVGDDDKADYILESSIEVNAALTIEPGVKVEMPKNGEFNVMGQGALIAEGTSNKPIIFTGEVETEGYWRGIWINSPSDDNALKHVRLRYGGGQHHSWDGKSILWLDNDNNAEVTIQNTVFEGSKQRGLHLEEGVALPGFQNNTFKDNNEHGVSIYASDLGKLDKGSDYDDDDKDANVRVNGNTITDNQTWRNINTAYKVTSGDLAIKADVTVQPGAEFHFDKDLEMNIHAEGSLNAVGQQNKGITFQGALETHGHWRGIWINSPSSKNRFEHVEIAHAAGRHHSWDGKSAIWVDSDSNGKLELSNCEIHQNTDWGLTVYQGASITPSSESQIESQNNFHDNGMGTNPPCSGDCNVNLK